jgi:hypothetical protein
MQDYPMRERIYLPVVRFGVPHTDWKYVFFYAEDYHASVRRTVGDVSADFPACELDEQLIQWMEEGNKLMLEITGETLDPTFLHLAA